MEDDVIHNVMSKRGCHLGMVPELAAARNSSTLLTLDHDLGTSPEMGRRLTVAKLARHVADLAGRLWSAGIRPGEHVAIHETANFDVWVLATAAARIGAVPVMLSPALTGPTISALLDRLDNPHLLTDAAKLDALADVGVADRANRVIIVTGHRPDAVSLTELAGAPPVAPVFRELEQPALITHTSGTTGLPKLVVHTARTPRARLRPQLFLLALMRKRETVAIHVSFVHSRMFAAMTLCLSRAMPVLLVNDSDPEEVAGFFSRYSPGLIEALPNSFLEWEGLASDPRKPFASVKYFSSTFDAIHPRTIGRLLSSSERRAPMFFQIYGQSGVGPAVGRPYFRRIEDLVLSRLVELSELVVVPGPESEPVPVLCTNDDQPLDRNRWRAAVTEFPQLADPIQLPRAELPRTATLKVQWIELSRRLHGRLGQRRDSRSLIQRRFTPNRGTSVPSSYCEW